MVKPQKITPTDRVQSDPTQGMIREEAITTDKVWSGLVRTAPGMTSGWHHHGEYETIVYVLSGVLRLEFGDEGQETLEAHAGDFVLIPSGLVHRESNPSGEESQLVGVRSGVGTPTFNVDGPQSA